MLVKSYHSDSAKGKLDFDCCSIGAASAALRLVLHNMCNRASSDAISTASESYVHDAQHDLYNITGRATLKYAKSDGVLKSHIINMLKALGIRCTVNPKVKSELLAKSSELQQYVTRSTQASTQQQ
jgi:hypothetical protein